MKAIDPKQQLLNFAMISISYGVIRYYFGWPLEDIAMLFSLIALYESLNNKDKINSIVRRF